jgi:hypothetical protein
MAITPRPEFATIDDFLIISGLSRRQFYNLVAEKKLKAHKMGTRVMVDVEHALEFIRSHPAPVVKPQTQRTTSQQMRGDLL